MGTHARIVLHHGDIPRLPADAVVEAAVRLSLGARSRAAALRFTERAGRWRLTELELALDPDVVLRAG